MIKSKNIAVSCDFIHQIGVSSFIPPSGVLEQKVSSAIWKLEQSEFREAKLEVIETEIPDVKIIKPAKFGDHRGFFSETWNQKALAEAGINVSMVQDNHSMSGETGTVRGLHYQSPPTAQDKLLRVVKGAIYDVAVDIRKNSPTFGMHVGIEISAELWNQVFIPRGFAHGFATLTENTEVLYKTSDYWSPEHEAGILWNDPALAIEWPVSEKDAIVLERDQNLPFLKDAIADLPF